MEAFGHLRHLVARFIEVLRGRGLGPREQAEAAALLTTNERPLFWAQAATDQRHGLECARRVLRARPGRIGLARAALLHDVGKRHAALGVLGRSLATGLAMFRVPVGARMRRYLDHGELGADDLAAAGAEALVVDFARHHHGARPAAISEDEWVLLQAADHGRSAV